jgi:hypothetical protein
MASVDRNTFNGLAKMTDVNAGGHSELDPFDGVFVFGMDAFPAFAMVSQSAMKNQTIDGGYGRAFNAGRGLVGEGGDTGPGVVGIAGNVIARPFKDTPRTLWEGPFPGQGWRAGVVGFGADPGARGERGGGGDAVGVLGHAEKSVGVWGRSTALPGVLGTATAHAGVYGAGPLGVVGDGTGGWIGVEGISGSQYGVYGHVDYKNTSDDMVGVFGAAAVNVPNWESYTGRAGVFVGPVDVIGNLTVTGDQVVWGTKSAAARHTDGTHRLLYCVESPESQFEDFGEAQLVKGAAKVKLDRDFAGVADTRHYHVFLTPYGDSRGLYVSARSRNGFVVREQGGGKSRLRFSYRVVAKRKHVATKRFQKVTRPKTPKLPTSLQRPDIDVQPRKTAAGGRAKSKRSKR